MGKARRAVPFGAARFALRQSGWLLAGEEVCLIGFIDASGGAKQEFRISGEAGAKHTPDRKAGAIALLFHRGRILGLPYAPIH